MRMKSCHIAPDRFSSQYLNDILLTEVSAGGSRRILPHVFLQRFVALINLHMKLDGQLHSFRTWIMR